MEGDAGASRLNPADTDDSSSGTAARAEQTSTETTAEGDRRGFGRIPRM